MLDVSSTASYEIALVRLSVLYLSVCPSVCSSLVFLKTGSLFFSDIVQDDSWLWYLVTEEGKFLKKELADQIKSGAKWGS